MSKRETVVRKSLEELATKPVSSDLSRVFGDDDIDRMAVEDGEADIDLGQGRFLDIEDLERLIPTRQRKQLVSIRLRPEVLDWYKSYGPGYQTFIGDLLAAYMKARKAPPKRTGRDTKGRDATGKPDSGLKNRV